MECRFENNTRNKDKEKSEMDIMEIIKAKEFNLDKMLSNLEEIKKLTYQKKDLQPQEFSEVFFEHITKKFLNAAIKVGQVKEDDFKKYYGLPTIPIVEIKKRHMQRLIENSV